MKEWKNTNLNSIRIQSWNACLTSAIKWKRLAMEELADTLLAFQRSRIHQNQTRFNLFKIRLFCLQENNELKEVTKFSYPLDVFKLLIWIQSLKDFSYIQQHTFQKIFWNSTICLSFYIIFFVHSYFFNFKWVKILFPLEIFFEPKKK